MLLNLSMPFIQKLMIIKLIIWLIKYFITHRTLFIFTVKWKMENIVLDSITIVVDSLAMVAALVPFGVSLYTYYKKLMISINIQN
jgi:hypothetical protein